MTMSSRDLTLERKNGGIIFFCFFFVFFFVCFFVVVVVVVVFLFFYWGGDIYWINLIKSKLVSPLKGPKRNTDYVMPLVTHTHIPWNALATPKHHVSLAGTGCVHEGKKASSTTWD